MKLPFGRDIVLWILWGCFLGILYYLGEKHYYMSHLTWFIALVALLSLVQVGLFWFIGKRKKEY